ncbi:MAG: DEAD/DEAH box helicase family protein [Chloroflexi bacterium]|nr:DEAD/DEAH box helicase family protein [Chloroflexota bacterium]
MELKGYQQKTLTQVKVYLEWLSKAKKEAGRRQTLSSEFADVEFFDFPKAAWGKVSSRPYYSKKNGLGEGLPDFYIKIPTGGGKTLLACHVIDLINRIYLKKQTGIVLWIVPTTQIYRQTLEALRNRDHPYRQVLDMASAGRTIISEKTERFSRLDVEENLVVMLLMLPSANRLNKEVLRIFKDTGGFTDFFPPEDDLRANEELLGKLPNLDYFGEDKGFFGKIAKTSLGNTLKILKPIIIIDEGHKAYSQSAQRTIRDFNPSIIVELSATPPEQSNILVEIGGQELNHEEMIKLDLHVYNKSSLKWQDVLREAIKRRDDLESKALEYEANTGIYIRPICPIQAERTGKEQRGTRYIHAEDVKDYLIKQSGVAPEKIAIKSSETDDIEGIDLLSHDCPIRFVITKQALQEGWDCPFAYILAVLTNPNSQLSMTQLVGRILRQPYAKKTKTIELDESYVFCFKPRASDLLESIRRGFQNEGLGDIAGSITIDKDDTGLPETSLKTVGYRDRFKHFEGKLYLPKFVIQENGSWRDVNYETDLLRRIDWNLFSLDYVFNLALDKRPLVDREVVVGLADNKRDVIKEKKHVYETLTTWQIDTVFMTRQLLDIVPNPWIAYGICDKAVKALVKRHGATVVSYNLAFLIEELRKHLESERDRLAEIVFRDLIAKKTLWFFLIADKGGYRLPSRLRIKNDTKRLVRASHSQLERSLFEEMPEEGINEMEKSVAICLDEQQKLLWWYRNLARRDYFIQGWKKNKIYPDFIFTDMAPSIKNDYDSIYVIETKGLHLMGNEDTTYKTSVFDFCNSLGKQRDWRELNMEFKNKKIEFQVIYEDEWRNRINQILG